MKKIIITLFTLLISISLYSCGKKVEPPKVDNKETEKIENLSEGTKERISYLHKEYVKNNKNIRGVFDYFNGFGLIKYSSITDVVYSEASMSNLKYDETSKTNIIVEGVDEADLIKNDNRYLYAVKNWNSNTFIVVDSVTNEHHEYSFKENENESDSQTISPYYVYNLNRIQGLYLTDNKLIVIVQNYMDLVIKVYDTKEPLNLELINEYTFENSSYNDSRMVDNELILYKSF